MFCVCLCIMVTIGINNSVFSRKHCMVQNHAFLPFQTPYCRALTMEVLDDEMVNHHCLIFLLNYCSATLIINQSCNLYMVCSFQVKSKEFCNFYNKLESREKMTFLFLLAKQYGLHQDIVLEIAKNVIASEVRRQ